MANPMNGHSKSCAVKVESGMRGLIGSMLAMAIGLGGCATATPRPELPAASYPQWAGAFSLVETCYAAAFVSAEDTVALRKTLNDNLSVYKYDSTAMSAMIASYVSHQRPSESSPANRKQLAQTCVGVRQKAATNRATEAQARTTQLHQAQLAAAQSQRRAAEASSWQPQPFVMPSIPSYQPPVIQTPTLRSGGADFYHCRQLGSYVVSCR